MSVCSDTTGPISFVEDSSVIIEEKGKMVVDEIFSGYTNIERIPILKGIPELLKSFFRDGSFRKFFSKENVVPNFVCHFVGRYICWTEFRSVDRAVKKMCDGVVCHVDSGIR